MNEIIGKIDIRAIIYEVRGRQVMLDRDVARLFQYETKDLNRNIKNNKERFPEEFCFKLTDEEYKNLRCKIFTSSSESKNYGERRYLPHVFTEYGITMLAGLLKSEVALKVSIEIVNEFIEMKKFIVNNAIVFERVMTIESKVDDKFLEYDKNFNEIFSLLRNEEEFTARIFYEGQIYDSHSILVDIIKSAKKDIVIIDNYITKVVLDLLTNKEDNVDVTIIGKNVLNLPQLDISKFNVQYPSLTIKYSDKYHDRFIIIDGDIVYHIGASLKDLGKKTFAINRINDNSLLGKII